MISFLVIFFLILHLGLMSTTDELQSTLRPTPTDDLSLDYSPASIETIIKPRLGWIAVNWAELYQSHELFYTLIIRDLKVRYKQTVLGVAWAVIQPVFTMVVFTVIFGRLVGVNSGSVPYPLFVFAALVPWTFFTNAVTGAGLSLVANQNMLTKIYFPRLYVPAATIGGFLVDMGIGLTLFLFLLPFYGYYPGWSLLALPFVIALTFTAAFGIGLILAAATVLYRDLRFVIPFCLQSLMYVSPVIYGADKIPRSLQPVAALNPMLGIINAFRSSILNMPWDFPSLAISIVSTAGLFIFGLFFFRKTERLIADIA
jgi:lipopolysaccharide transport system permease protein